MKLKRKKKTRKENGEKKKGKKKRRKKKRWREKWERRKKKREKKEKKRKAEEERKKRSDERGVKEDAEPRRRKKKRKQRRKTSGEGREMEVNVGKKGLHGKRRRMREARGRKAAESKEEFIHVSNADYHHQILTGRMTVERKRIFSKTIGVDGFTDLHAWSEATPTAKTANSNDFAKYVKHILSGLGHVLQVTAKRRTLPRLRLHAYKCRIAKLDAICRQIVGYRKRKKPPKPPAACNRPTYRHRRLFYKRPTYKRPVVFFGDFTDNGGVKYGHRRPPIKAIRHRLRLHAHVIDLDEYRSSKFCSTCTSNQSLATTQLLEVENVEVGEEKMHAVVRCGVCNQVWNRDVNACRNLRGIVKYGLANAWSRPPIFQKM